MYKDRLLLYVDILGWSAAIRSGGENDRLLRAVRAIHEHALVHNESFRRELRAEDGKKIRVNPMFLEVQFGAFSDHLVFSLPESFGSRIVAMASKLIVDLLKMGWLTRGAIVVGPLYQQDNIVFGPALLEAVEMEENEVVHPRILLSDEAVELLAAIPSDPRYKILIKDQEGQFVVNPFALPFQADCADLLERFANDNLGLPQVKENVEEQIAHYMATNRMREAGKWSYLEEFITRRVLIEIPALKPFWR